MGVLPVIFRDGFVHLGTTIVVDQCPIFFTHQNHQHLHEDGLIFASVCIICDLLHLMSREANRRACCPQLKMRHFYTGWKYHIMRLSDNVEHTSTMFYSSLFRVFGHVGNRNVVHSIYIVIYLPVLLVFADDLFFSSCVINQNFSDCPSGSLLGVPSLVHIPNGFTVKHSDRSARISQSVEITLARSPRLVKIHSG